MLRSSRCAGDHLVSTHQPRPGFVSPSKGQQAPVTSESSVGRRSDRTCSARRVSWSSLALESVSRLHQSLNCCPSPRQVDLASSYGRSRVHRADYLYQQDPRDRRSVEVSCVTLRMPKPEKEVHELLARCPAAAPPVAALGVVSVDFYSRRACGRAPPSSRPLSPRYSVHPATSVQPVLYTLGHMKANRCGKFTRSAAPRCHFVRT